MIHPGYSAATTTEYLGAIPTVTTQTFNGLGQAITQSQAANPGDPGTHLNIGPNQYDDRGALVSTSQPWFGSTDVLTAAASGTSIGAPSAAQVINIGHDPFGRTITTMIGTHTVKTITRHALMSQTQDEWQASQGTSTTAYLNGFGELDSTAEPTAVAGDALITAYSHNVASQITESAYFHTTGNESNAQATQYDSLGRPIWRTDFNAANGAGIGWRYLWDTNSNLVATSDPRGCGENFYYDAGKRMVAEDYSPCQINQPAYSPIITFGDAPTGDNAEVFYRYDSYETGQVAPESGFDDRSSYARRRLTAVEDRGAHTRYNYDARGHVRRVSRQMAKQGTEPLVADRYTPHWYDVLSAYDNGDRLTSQKARSYEPSFTYSGEADEWFTYNPRGQLATRGFGGTAGPSQTLVTAVNYDADGSPLQITHGDPSQMLEVMSYDPSLRYITGLFVGRVTQPPFWTSPPAGYSAPTPNTDPVFLELIAQQITHGPGGDPIDVTTANSSLHWNGGAAPATTTHYDYWPDQRLKAVTRTFNATANGGAWVSPHAAENAAGDHTPVPAQIAAGRSTSQTFAYDWLGNTTNTADNESLFFDRSLGVITNGIDVDGNAIGPNQISMANRNLFVSYDYAGNVVSTRVERAGTCEGGLCIQRTDFNWDEVNQMQDAERYDYSGNTMPASEPAFPSTPSIAPTVTLYFGYSEGARVRKSTKTGIGTVHDLDVSSMQRLHGVTYQNDVAEYVPVEDELISYLSAGERIIHDSSGQMPSLTHNQQHVIMSFADRMGSSSVAVDYETSEVVERVDYLAYGQVEGDARYSRWKTDRDQFNLTGKEEDRELGLHYFGARYYNANLGRWMSLDPLVIHGGMVDPNPYAYVSGKPSRMIDPLGLVEQDTPYDYGYQYEFANDAGKYWAPDPPAPAQDTGPGLWGMVEDLAMGPIAAPNAAIDAVVHGATAAANGELTDYAKQAAISSTGLDLARPFVPPLAATSAAGAQAAKDAFKAKGLLAAALAAPALRAPLAGSIRGVNPTGGTMNCANCAIATDATLGGSPASALPGGPTSPAVLARYFGRNWIPTTPRGMSTIMREWGAGSRGIVWGTRGSEMGHFFNVVNQGGVVRFLDGQAGGAATLEGYDGFFLLRTN